MSIVVLKRPVRVRWRAKIRDGARAAHLGTFVHQWQAAAAYDTALIALGYAPLNFPLATLRSLTPPGAFEHALIYVQERLGLPQTPLKETLK